MVQSIGHDGVKERWLFEFGFLTEDGITKQGSQTWSKDRLESDGMNTRDEGKLRILQHIAREKMDDYW